MKLASSWQKVLESEMNKPYFIELMAKVNHFYNEKSEHILPEKSKVFNAFNLCSFEAL